MVGESISAAFFFWLGKARMIKKPIRGLGLDVDICIFIDWEKGRSYGKVGTFSFFFFFRSVFRMYIVQLQVVYLLFTFFFVLCIWEYM